MSDTRYFRHISNGRIYSWCKSFEENPDLEEITEEEAFPERFVPKKQLKRKSKLKLDTAEVPEPKSPIAEELGVEASTGTP